MHFLTSEYAATHRPSEILFSWIWLWNDWRLCGCVHLSDIRQLARSPAPCPTPYISNVSTSLLDERCVDATLTLWWRTFWVKSHTWQIIVTVVLVMNWLKWQLHSCTTSCNYFLMNLVVSHFQNTHNLIRHDPDQGKEFWRWNNKTRKRTTSHASIITITRSRNVEINVKLYV